MDVTLHAAPRGSDVVREQIRIVGVGLRREALVAAVVFGILTIAIVIDIFRCDAATWFDSTDWTPIAVAAFLFPFAVWRRDARFKPAFLWTLPVDRRKLALAKVFAGWVWMIAALALLIGWQSTLARFSRVANAEAMPVIALIGATAMYLFGSALILALRHPVRWLVGTAGVFFLLGLLNQLLGLGPDGRTEAIITSTGVFSALDHLERISRMYPPFALWAIATFLWVGAGLAALLAAASRHRERRRH
jgi:hypothetical protein